jgi:hypothetical protein
MAIYLYNLEFSLTGSNLAVGAFQPYPSALPPSPNINNVSSAWFTATGAAPPGVQPYFQVLTQPLTPTQWGSPQSDANDLTLDPGDYLLLRVFTLDPNLSAYQMRFTGVFGQGTSEVPSGEASNLQSPLVMSSATSPNNIYPRTVIDVDGSQGPSWPASLNDGSWVMCLGQVVGAPQDAANDYTFNVGACVYVNSNPPPAGNLFTFGRDPRMHVSGVGMGTRAA